MAGITNLRRPSQDSLRPAHQHAAQLEVCLATLVCLSQHGTKIKTISKGLGLYDELLNWLHSYTSVYMFCLFRYTNAKVLELATNS